MNTIITLDMEFERETKGAIRYADTNPDSVMQTIYIRKRAFPDGKYPRRLAVTLLEPE